MALMASTKITMRVCLIRKRIFLSRGVVRSLGNPTHLGFWYDESNRNLSFSPVTKDDVDAFEIPAHYWSGTKQSCEITRIAFLLALQYRAGWEERSRYAYNGVLKNPNGIPVVVFNLADGAKLI
jgi:hypothetical protein